MDSDVDKDVNSALFGTDDEDDENDDNSDDVNHDTFEQEDDQDQAVGHGNCGEPDDDAPVEAVPEEDGHVNAEGLIYQQPRAPFAGTIWNGTLNGFPRIDQENLRRPSGG